MFLKLHKSVGMKDFFNRVQASTASHTVLHYSQHTMSSVIPKEHTAVRIHEHGDTNVLRVEKVPVSDLQSDQVLIRNHYAGVNYIDTYHRSGLYSTNLPYTLGVDGGGEVVAVGSAVPAELGLKEGDFVVYMSSAAYAEYTAVAANRVVKLPEGLDLQTGIAAMVQGMTAVALATSAYPVAAGEWILVFAAAGGTGSLVTQVAAAAGAHVIGVASTEEKAKLVKSYGAEHTLLSDDPDLVKKVLELTGGQGVRAVFDGVGAATWEASKAVLGYLGTLISFGNASGKVPPVEINTYPKNIKVMRFTLYEEQKYNGPTAIANKTLDLVQSGKLKVNIYKVFPLAEAAEAHKEIEGRKTTGKILLDTRADNK